MNISEFTSLLESRTLGPKKNGNGWTSRCPAHDDKTPSLNYSGGANRKILLYCHARGASGRYHRRAWNHCQGFVRQHETTTERRDNVG